MAADKPLTGIELIDCAKANARQGLDTATHLCGYGTDTSQFRQAVIQACQDIGVEVHELSDLITDQQRAVRIGTIEIAPDTPDDL